MSVVQPREHRVIPAQAGIQDALDPRLRGGDGKRLDAFRIGL
jgi:hypothetical protein